MRDSCWGELQEPMALPLWEALLDAAAVGWGTRLLHAGCGAGGACALAARRGAHVNGLDAAHALLAIARQRVPDGDFRAGALEALPYETGAFDAIIAANALHHATAPVAALGEMRRVCARGGRVVIATLGRPEECELHVVFSAVRRLLPAPAADDPFALSAPGALDMLIRSAGLRVIGHGTADCPLEYSDSETAWHAQASAGVLQAALHAVGAPQLKAAVLRALAPFQTSGGNVRMENRFRYIAATPSLRPRRLLEGHRAGSLLVGQSCLLVASTWLRSRHPDAPR